MTEEEAHELAIDLFTVMVDNASDDSYQIIPHQHIEDALESKRDKYMDLAEEAILAAKCFSVCWAHKPPPN